MQMGEIIKISRLTIHLLTASKATKLVKKCLFLAYQGQLLSTEGLIIPHRFGQFVGRVILVTPFVLPNDGAARIWVVDDLPKDWLKPNTFLS